MSVQTISRAVLAVLVLAVALPSAFAADKGHHRGKQLEVEVAENGTRFLPDAEPVFPDDGFPAYGAEFITEGYLYPAGTVSCAANECNGVLADGQPEFPDKVIGRWVCRGWHVGDGAHTVTGPWVVSTQTFDLSDMPGSEMIVTDGYEYSDFNVEFLRAVTGGTGRYRSARGEQRQEFLGWNPSFGTVLRVNFQLR